MNATLLSLYCRASASAVSLRARAAEATQTLFPARPEGGMLYEPAGRESEVGLSELATTVILVAVGVALVIAVVAILGPAIMNLVNKTGNNIESVPLDWGG